MVKTTERKTWIKHHRVVSQAEWLAARKGLLVKEKKFTRLRDQLSQQRRDLPWVKVDKSYVFEGPDGKQTLPELFDGRGQLIYLSLHVWPACRGRMPALLVAGRQF